MTNLESFLKVAEERCEKATPGNWKVAWEGRGGENPSCALIECDEDHYPQIAVDHRYYFSDPAPDARFIAASRTDLPKALKIIRAMREQLKMMILSHPATDGIDSWSYRAQLAEKALSEADRIAGE